MNERTKRIIGIAIVALTIALVARAERSERLAHLFEFSAPSVIPTSSKPPEKTGDVGIPKQTKVNVNTAGVFELMTLTGVGEVKAKAIVEYRNEHGPFRGVQDIVNVKGIGPKTFESIKDDIIVSFPEHPFP